MREIDEKILTGQITPGVDGNGVFPGVSIVKESSSRPLGHSDSSQSSSSQTPPSASTALGLESTKKRKRRTSFTPQALDLLSQFFERNTHPSGSFLEFRGGSQFTSNLMGVGVSEKSDVGTGRGGGEKSDVAFYIFCTFCGGVRVNIE